MDKPFVFGVPVDESHFTGREEETKRLSSNFRYGINTILLSPRRWGKTSLVNKVAKTISSKEVRVICLDIFSCRSEYDFYNVFSAAILKGMSDKIDEWKDMAKGFIERLVPKLSISPDNMSEYSVSLGITPKTHSPEEILNLPETIAQRKKCHIVICIDEFQQVGEFPDSLSFQKRLRSAWQHHKNISYCLYGSKMHLMTSLFQKKSFPFYKFGEIMYLKNIPLESWVPYIQRQFKSAGKEIYDETVKSLCETVDYQSSYVQQLAYCTLLRTNKTATPEILQAATIDLIEQNSSIFIEQVQSLTSYQLNFLRAVISGINSNFGEEKIRDEFHLGSPSNISRLKTSLINKELIEQTASGIVIGDPVLKLWLRKIL